MAADVGYGEPTWSGPPGRWPCVGGEVDAHACVDVRGVLAAVHVMRGTVGQPTEHGEHPPVPTRTTAGRRGTTLSACSSAPRRWAMTAVGVVGGVLVDQGGRDGGVTHAALQRVQGGAGAGGQGGAGVPQVVPAQVGRPAAARAREHGVRGPPRSGRPVSVANTSARRGRGVKRSRCSASAAAVRRRQVHGAAAGVGGLRRPERDRLPGELDSARARPARCRRRGRRAGARGRTVPRRAARTRRRPARRRGSARASRRRSRRPRPGWPGPARRGGPCRRRGHLAGVGGDQLLPDGGRGWCAAAGRPARPGCGRRRGAVLGRGAAVGAAGGRPRRRARRRAAGRCGDRSRPVARAHARAACAARAALRRARRGPG